MLKGFAFKILAPKDITGVPFLPHSKSGEMLVPWCLEVLNMIGVHPAVAADNIDRLQADGVMTDCECWL